MPTRLTIRITAIATSLALLATGCADAPQPTPAPTPIDVAAAKAKAATEAAEAASKAAAAKQQSTPDPEPAPEQAAKYEPPFPDRVNLFAPSKQATRSERQTFGDSAESVVLMGFANLDGPRVVLAVDGMVHPLSLNEEAYGVRVISIEPPRAVLQRGRSRWTASLE